MISENGQVFSILNQQVIKPRISKRGYFVVDLNNGKGRSNGGRTLHTIHRLLYKTFIEDTDLGIDHIDGNPLNNALSNLRACSHAQNMKNSRPRKNTTSKFKGVCFEKYTMRWRAQIVANGKHFSIGRFDSEEQAAIAYDLRAKEVFGEYARLNFAS